MEIQGKDSKKKRVRNRNKKAVIVDSSCTNAGTNASTNASTKTQSMVQTRIEYIKARRQEETRPPIKEYDRKCFACDKVCESRNQLNHHFGGCAAFHAKFDKLPAIERSWHMILQYALYKPKIAGRICIGCGIIQTSRDALHQHFLKCDRALSIDQWDRISMFGLLEGTEHDDSVVHMKNYVPRPNIKEYIQRLYNFVKALKLERDKKQHDELQKKMKTCSCIHCAYAQNEPPIAHAGLSQAQKDGYVVVPVMMAGYGTVLNGRTVYVPQQQVYVRIHDKGPAPESVQVHVE